MAFVDSALLEILACPACLGQLRFEPTADAPFLEGSLTCDRCERAYAIRAGLPLLLLKDARWKDNRLEIKDETELVDEMPDSEQVKRNRFETQRSWEFLKKIPIPHRPLVLDIGGSAGIGAYLFRSFQAHVVVVDIVPSFLVMGKMSLGEKVDLSPAAADMEWLPFADETFDVVFCRQALHHSSTPRQAVREMFRVAKTGGHVLLVSEPCRTAYHRIKEWYERKRHGLRLEKGEGLLQRLPDLTFQYTWGDFKRTFSQLAPDYCIERAVGAATMRPTEDGIAYDPGIDARGKLGRILDRILPFGQGHRGDVNVSARKTAPVRRETACPEEVRPVDPRDLEVEVPSKEEVQYFRGMLEGIFAGMQW